MPEDFLDAIADALDRAQSWIERGVLPHYARYHRGDGVEMRLRLLRDLEEADLVPGAFTPEHGRWQRFKTRRFLKGITVELYDWPMGSLSHIFRTASGYEIQITPYALWRAGFRDPVEIDDAILRVLLARYVQVIGGTRLYVSPDREWDELIDEARWTDNVAAFWSVFWTVVYAGVAGVVIAMFWTITPR